MAVKPVPAATPGEDSRDDDGCAYGYGGYTRQGTTAPTRRGVPAASRRLAACGQNSGKSAVYRLLHTAAGRGDGGARRFFGRGLVLSVRPMGGDALLEVAFDTVGTKKLMLKAASHHLKKV